MDMNEKMINDITQFFNNVGDYLGLEYSSKIHSRYFNDKNINDNFDIVGRYYLGGNNIPDTAGMIAEYLKHRKY